MSHLISVIIPVYQVEAYIDDCVKSVLSQTHTELEVILVDDGSTDKSPERCDYYAQHDPRVKVIHKSNGGLSSARNAGLEMARAQYITFVDSDDVIAPNMLQVMIELAEQENADIVKIDVVRKKSMSECIPQMGTHEILQPLTALKRIFNFFPPIITTCGKLFKKVLFENIRFPEGRYYEDEVTTPKLFYAAKKIVFCNASLYFYMQRENQSILRSPFSRKKCEDALFMSEDRIDFFRKNNLKDLETKALEDFYHRLNKMLVESIQIGDEQMVTLLLKKKDYFKKEFWKIALKIEFITLLSRIKRSLMQQ